MEIPEKTLILVTDGSANSAYWSMDLFGGRAVMRVVCQAKATNISKYAVELVGAKMRRPPTAGRVLILTPGDEGDEGRVDGAIPSLGMREVRLEFAIEPPIVKGAKSFEADLAVVDQFKNEHWLARVRFRHVPSGRVLSRAS
jgi:hypothetical protein